MCENVYLWGIHYLWFETLTSAWSRWERTCKEGKRYPNFLCVFFHLLIVKSTAKSCRVSSASPVLADYCLVVGTIWRIARKAWEGYELRDSWCYPSVFSRSDSSWAVRSQWVLLGCLGCGGEHRRAVQARAALGLTCTTHHGLKS